MFFIVFFFLSFQLCFSQGFCFGCFLGFQWVFFLQGFGGFFPRVLGMALGVDFLEFSRVLDQSFGLENGCDFRFSFRVCFEATKERDPTTQKIKKNEVSTVPIEGRARQTDQEIAGLIWASSLDYAGITVPDCSSSE